MLVFRHTLLRSDAMAHPDTPLFPLDTVVFPEGVAPLRIVEPRYIDLVALCMKQSASFGVCAQRPVNNSELGAPHTVGTLVDIVDFDQRDDGYLGITVEGRHRFHVTSMRQADNGLWWGKIEYIDEHQDVACPAEFDTLKQVAEALFEQAGAPWNQRRPDFESARWLSARLTELLPFDPATKHALLATDDPVERLRQIQPLVRIENNA